jgi:hypothetical protein
MPTDTKPTLPPTKTAANYNERKLESEWLRDHSQEFPGEWVALDGNRLLAHGLDPKKVFAQARASKVARPLFAHLEPSDRLAEIGGI